MLGFCNLSRAFAAVALLLPGTLPAQGVPAPPLAPVAFVGVTVVDVEHGTLLPNQTVVVAGGRIERVEESHRALPPGTTVIPARGRYLLPGLWDMHVHLAAVAIDRLGNRPGNYEINASWHLPLFLAHGVTGVRDMAGNFRMLRTWRDQIASGERAGPRIVHTGWKIGAAEPVVPRAPRDPHTESDLRRAVALAADAGVDFIKVETLQPEELRVVAEEAHKRGLQVVGHVGPWMTLRTASELGLDGVEHLHQGVAAGSAEDDALAESADREFSWWGERLVRIGWWDHARRRRQRAERMLVTWDSVTEARTIEVLVRNHTEQTPTLSALRDIQRIQPEIPPARLAWLPPKILRTDTTDKAVGPWREQIFVNQFALQMRVTRMMQRAGVPILAGTDSPGTRRVPGMSLVDELELLVEAGLTNLEALQAATIAPARFMRMSDSLGTVTPGKVADLVLVDENPLASLGALRSVRAVVAGGRYYSREELDRRLEGVREVLAQLRRDAAPSAVASDGAAPGSNP